MELKGTKGFAAYQTYESIIAFLPTCAKYQNETFLDKNKGMNLNLVFEDFKSLPEDEKKFLILESLQVNILSDQQVTNLLRVHNDRNGRAISPQSVGNYNVTEVMKMVLNTCVTCSEIESELFF